MSQYAIIIVVEGDQEQGTVLAKELIAKLQDDDQRIFDARLTAFKDEGTVTDLLEL